MKIITEPSVHVLALPIFFGHPKYELPVNTETEDVFVNATEDTDGWRYDPDEIHFLTAHAGKGCYDSYGKDGRSIKDHIVGLINSKHGSVLEHAHISLFLEGISRGCSHEIVRHRHFNYSQRSTRYTAEEDAAIVLDPFYTELANHFNDNQGEGHCAGAPDCMKCHLYEDFITSCDQSIRQYSHTVAKLILVAPEGKSKTEIRKWARGKARQLLPHALETRMTITGNLRAWRHFLEERTGAGAEPEIRRLAEKIYKTIKPLAPYVFEDYKEEMVEGFIELHPANRKV